MTRRRMWWMLLSIVAAATQKRTKAAEKPQLVFDLRGIHNTPCGWMTK